jgi:cytoskeletal protein CcmA (bactofilin family)
MLNRENWRSGNGGTGTVKADPPPPAPAPERRSEAREANPANIGSSVFVKGELSGLEDLTVDGKVEGRIHLPDHALTIGPNAKIQADIVAKVITVFGTVVGGVTARDKVEIRRGGSLEGDLVCARMAIQEGAYFHGHVNMGPRAHEKAAAPPKAEPVLAGAV